MPADRHHASLTHELPRKIQSSLAGAWLSADLVSRDLPDSSTALPVPDCSAPFPATPLPKSGSDSLQGENQHIHMQTT